MSDDNDKPPPARWPWVVGILIIVVFVAVVLYEVFVPKADVWTDDAYVTVHYATIGPRVSGQVQSVDVNDNQVVHAGQVLVTLDPRDYETDVARAEAQMARDTAQVTDASANVSRQPALIEEQQAAVASAQARLDFAQTDKRRYENLAETGAGTRQQRQQAYTDAAESAASLAGAQAALEATRRQLDVLHAQVSSYQATVKSDAAALRQARLNLSYTRIVAPVDGTVGERNVEVGNIVSPGAGMMVVVPLRQNFIEANYRELALRHVQPGQHVTIHVDAYNIDLDGIVNSIPPATGSAFAPIAPSNATGNFTKIVQRLPVKIVLTPGQRLANLLRVGLSVETTIHTGLADVVGRQRDSDYPVTSSP